MVLGPVPTVAGALELVDSEPAPDIAVLDINLQGEMAYPVADALRARRIRLLFATGYDAKAIPPAYGCATGGEAGCLERPKLGWAAVSRAHLQQ